MASLSTLSRLFKRVLPSNLILRNTATRSPLSYHSATNIKTFNTKPVALQSSFSRCYSSITRRNNDSWRCFAGGNLNHINVDLKLQQSRTPTLASAYATTRSFSSTDRHSCKTVGSDIGKGNISESSEGIADSSSSSSSESGSSSESSSDESSAGFDSVNHIKMAVLDAALQHIPETGFTEQSIAKGAESLGYSSMMHGIVEGAGAELFTHLQGRLNEELEEQLLQWKQQGHHSGNQSAFIEEALKFRLELILPYLPHWSRGLVTASMSPQHACRGVANVAAMADHVAHYSGNNSVDSGWYTGRIAIGVVYKLTELSLLQDQSTNFKETWSFLQRRVSEGQSCCNVFKNLDTVAADTAKLAAAGIATGFNILGMNGRFR